MFKRCTLKRAQSAPQAVPHPTDEKVEGMKEVETLRAEPEIAWGMTQSSAFARDLDGRGDGETQLIKA